MEQTIPLTEELPVACAKCVEALEKARFKKIEVSADKCTIHAQKWVSSQWTTTPLTVSLQPQDTGTLVTVTSESSAQSLISAVRSPSDVIVRKFVKALTAA